MDLAREGRRNSLPGMTKFMASDYRVDYAPRNVLLSHGEAKHTSDQEIDCADIGISAPSARLI